MTAPLHNRCTIVGETTNERAIINITQTILAPRVDLTIFLSLDISKVGSSLPPATIELGNSKVKKSLYPCQQFDTRFTGLSNGSVTGAERNGFQAEKGRSKAENNLTSPSNCLPRHITDVAARGLGAV